MYIGFTMTPGTNATEIQSSVTWYYALALRLENLPEMYPASSKPSYDGHGELFKTWDPASQVLVIVVDNASPTLVPNAMQTVPPSTQADPETPSHPREVDNGVSRTSGGGEEGGNQDPSDADAASFFSFLLSYST